MQLLDLLGRRWALRVLWELRDPGGLRFRELQQRCEDISPTSLTQRLVDLTDARIVEVDVDGTYYLTAQGRELGRLLIPISAWAKRWAR
jgi:DNA-binding HxlR family transcriptional regulator